jgi:hypothetical protein
LSDDIDEQADELVKRVLDGDRKDGILAHRTRRVNGSMLSA